MKIKLNLNTEENQLTIHKLKNDFFNQNKVTFVVESLEQTFSELGNYHSFELALVEDEKDTQTKEVEWENGDIAIYDGSEALVIAYHPHHPSVVIEMPNNEYLNVLGGELSKPETPEAKKEREELESAYDLYCVAFGDSEHLCDSYENFCKEDAHKFCRNAYIAIVRKTGYRVEKWYGED